MNITATKKPVTIEAGYSGNIDGISAGLINILDGMTFNAPASSEIDKSIEKLRLIIENGPSTED